MGQRTATALSRPRIALSSVRQPRAPRNQFRATARANHNSADSRHEILQHAVSTSTRASWYRPAAMSHACSNVRQALANVFRLMPTSVVRAKPVTFVRHAPVFQRLLSSTCQDRRADHSRALQYIRRAPCCPELGRSASFSSSPCSSARNSTAKRKRQSRNDDAPASIDHALSHDFRAIFPGVAGAVSAADGALIVRTLHGRRIDGSLAELGVRIDGLPPTVPHKALVHALSWLRTHHPVDERAAADAYVAREADRLERELAGASATASRPGTSVIEEFKRFHEERRAREAREEEERKKDAPVVEEALPPAHVVEAQRKVEMRTLAGPTSRRAGWCVWQSLTCGDLGRQRNAEWKEYYRERAVVSQATEPPDMSNVRGDPLHSRYMTAVPR